MEKILVKLALMVTISLFSGSLVGFLTYHDINSQKDIKTATKKVLTIQWKPIEVFPEEGYRFK